ncbi:volvatoxin A2 precursor [Beauveria bassiana ARSEF 2860]|uniref:Volvatoxin A2 n=1 Tax=Beauveria bassiana (strain ARSEF 2860) TaxID=655819 RepID=J5JGP3_BEAB2|nr:volvatoxin A2 precursor [Beauveria bassiana ARSEF 2860]EJP62706.1 volvatoxin A2 precursor [Beauveria bassiana ARSEF 2860]
MSDPATIKFDSFSKLPTWLLPTSSQVMAYAGNYDKSDLEGIRFDWNSFKQSIGQNASGDIAFDKEKVVTIDRQDRTVQTMVDQIVSFLADALSYPMSQHDIKALNKTIQTTFYNLKNKSSYGFLNFSSTTDHHNSSWTYNINFAFPNPDIPNYFNSLISTVILEADITDVSEWWGLEFNTTKSFSAKIHSIELVVKKGFANPDARPK